MTEILIVDDSKVMREMIVACLRADASFNFTLAEGGLEAIERLTLRAYDVVVLDVDMPDLGGIEVVEYVRGQASLEAIPIIIVTTRADDDSRDRAIAAGATRFMTKPFEPGVLLFEVRSLLPGTKGVQG
jgi:two-component system, chemotaxis family, chemotaxis protein CheY